MSAVGRTWEDVHVISLTGMKRLLLIFDRVERGPRSKDNLPLRPFNSILEFYLRQPDRVGQRENDRPWVQLGHAFDHCFVECILRVGILGRHLRGSSGSDPP